MASKNTDIIEQLADTIVANLTTPVAKRGKETAPNDKSFYATILGVNQKFVDTISMDDQTALIEKFSLPESIEDGENNYYIFKINGAYYCKQQNGDFKLYDKIMVYIPNGDWSRMYFDYDYGNGIKKDNDSNNSNSFRRIIASVEPPGGSEPQLGDIWFCVNDNSVTEFTEIPATAFTALYVYLEDESTQVKNWVNVKCPITQLSPPSDPNVGDYYIKKSNDNKLSKIYMCTNVSGGSITWSEVYPESETGTDYNFFMSLDKPITSGDIWVEIDSYETLNIKSCSVWDFFEEEKYYGWNLLYNDASGSGVGENVGLHNERFNGYTASDGSVINGGDYNHAEGRKHTLNGCYYVHVSGYENKATSCSSDIISGDLNVLIAVYRSIVVGNSNDVTNNTGTSAVFGNNNQVSGVHNALICGEDNDVTASDGACFGQNNVLTIDGCVAVGYGANTTNMQNNVRLIVGNGAGNAFYVTSHGDCYAAGGYNSMGADYAETYEWLDGNPDNEDRRGLFVTLDKKFIKKANSEDDYILGVVSATPTICGDTYDLNWRGKYQTDIFGALLFDENGNPMLSPEYNPDLIYIPQSQRKEKSKIGTQGKLVVVDDGTCIVNKYCKPSNGGIGTYSDNKNDYRVIERLDDTHVKIIIK